MADLSTLETSPAPLAAASAPYRHPSPAVSATAPSPRQPSRAPSDPSAAAVSPCQPSLASSTAAASPHETPPEFHGEPSVLPGQG